jgi:methylated-DNA-protein-cysteine methyltransferase related protein
VRATGNRTRAHGADFRGAAASKAGAKNLEMQAAIRQIIRSIPRGRVATYGQVAEAAGYPLYHRQVAQVLRKYGRTLPWQRVLGAGGQLKTCLESKLEQRTLLEMEGVRFRGARVDMKQHQATFGKANARSKAPRPRT